MGVHKVIFGGQGYGGDEYEAVAVSVNMTLSIGTRVTHKDGRTGRITEVKEPICQKGFDGQTYCTPHVISLTMVMTNPLNGPTRSSSHKLQVVPQNPYPYPHPLTLPASSLRPAPVVASTAQYNRRKRATIQRASGH